MEKIKQEEKLSPKQYSIKKILEKFVNKNHISYKIEGNNLYINRFVDFDKISKNIDKIIIDKFDNIKITDFNFLGKNIIIIDTGEKKYIKVICNINNMEYIIEKIKDTFKNIIGYKK